MKKNNPAIKGREFNERPLFNYLLYVGVQGMNTKQADEKLRMIQELAQEIEEDEELKKIDERYAIAAQWIDTDIDNVNV